MMTADEARARTVLAIKDNPKVRECCKDDDALVTQQVGSDKFYSVCRHCGSRHIRWVCDFGNIINVSPF